MKAFYATALFAIVWLQVLGQENNSNIWYFGKFAGIDFNNGDPIALIDGQLNTWEGCASICNQFGELLFYTDGRKIYNRDHQVMPNGDGLLGDFSSSQSAIIVPKPHTSSKNNLYYVFTTDNWQDNLENGFRYSIIDMSLDGGRGDVTAEKNILIHAKVAEKVAAIHHANGVDVWVVAHSWGNNDYLAYKLTNDGLLLTPVISSIGYNYAGNYNIAAGQLKFTLNGKYLASSINYVNRLEILKFDNSTGVLSDLIYFQDPVFFNRVWGIEFSPNGRFLYFSKRPPEILYQLDIVEWDSLAIINSAEVIESTNGLPSEFDAGTLQLGPNRKIYLTRFDKPFLSVINQPDNESSNTGFEEVGVGLDGRLSQWGLPNLYQFIFEADFTYQPHCQGDSTWFNLTYSSAIDSVFWDFGDPVSGSENYSKLQHPFHIFSNPGTFIVKAIIYLSGNEYPIEKSVVIFPNPFVDLGNDTMLCSQSGILLKAGNGYDTYLWQDGSTDSVFLVSQSGDYWVAVENSCGTATDSIHVDFSESFEIDLGNDTSFCYGHTVVLSPGSGYYAYFWQDGSTDSLLLAGLSGYYWVQVTDSMGCTAIDSVYIEAYMDFGFSIGPDTAVICDGDYLFLHGPNGYPSYEWQDGSNYPDFVADTTGIYWLEITDENGCAARDSMLLIVNKVPDDFLGNDTVMCADDYFPIHAPSHYDKYVWQDGSTDSAFIAWETGNYWVYVEDSIGCSGIDSIKLSLFDPPQLNQGTDTTICPGENILLTTGYNWLGYLWNTGSTDSAILVTKEGWYWVETATQCGVFTDSIYVKIYSNPDFGLGADTNICKDESIWLSPGFGFPDYLWNDGSTDSILIVREEGTYWVEVYDGRCYLSDSLLAKSCSILWIPNVFTPNADGYNDTFYAIGEFVREFEMIIFNRWGKVMTTLRSIDEEWDGTHNGQRCSDGVYYYVVTYTEPGRGAYPLSKQIEGAVMLIGGK